MGTQSIFPINRVLNVTGEVKVEIYPGLPTPLFLRKSSIPADVNIPCNPPSATIKMELGIRSKGNAYGYIILSESGG